MSVFYIVVGPEGPCLLLDDRRIAGPKPWAGGEVVQKFVADGEYRKVETCHDVHEPPKNTSFWPSPHFKCSECGEVHVSMQYVYFCPNCGRKVVDE